MTDFFADGLGPNYLLRWRELAMKTRFVTYVDVSFESSWLNAAAFATPTSSRIKFMTDAEQRCAGSVKLLSGRVLRRGN